MFTQRATGVRTELVGAGLCSARREAVSLREFTANPYVLTPFVVGADAHIGPLGINEFAENYRKIAAFCGRTESSAPTESAKGCCRGRRLCRPIEKLQIRRRFP